MLVAARTWFHAVHVEKYDCHSRAASATDNPTGLTVSRWLLIGTLNAMVMIAAKIPKTAPTRTHTLPGCRMEDGDHPDHHPRIVAPKYAERKAGWSSPRR